MVFDIETANKKAERDGVELSFIPGKEEDTPENQEFKERVRMFQYLITTMKETITKKLSGDSVSTQTLITVEKLPTPVCRTA